MEDIILSVLSKVGLGGLPACALFFYIKSIKNELDAHIAKHESFEKNMLEEIKRLHDRINPIASTCSKMEGYLEALLKK